MCLLFKEAYSVVQIWSLLRWAHELSGHIPLGDIYRVIACMAVSDDQISLDVDKLQGAFHDFRLFSFMPTHRACSLGGLRCKKCCIKVGERLDVGQSVHILCKQLRF